MCVYWLIWYFVNVIKVVFYFFFFFSSRRRHTRCLSDWSSFVCSSDLMLIVSEGFRPGELSSRALFPPQPRDYQPDFVVRNLRRQRFFQWFEPLQSQAGTRRLDHSTPRFLYPVRLEF